MKETKRCEPEHFAPLLGYCHHQVVKLLDRRLRQYDVSSMQCRTLIFLRKQGGSAPQKALQEHLMVKPSTVNGIVGRLEEKGLLTRAAGDRDGRCRVLTLTDRGRGFYDDFVAVTARMTEQMEQGFTAEELQTLRSCLLRVADNLRREEETD